MSTQTQRADRPSRMSLSRIASRRDVAAGLILVVVAGLTFWLNKGLDLGQLSDLGAGFMPRAAALAVGILGCILLAAACFQGDASIEKTGWKGPLLITAALAGFAALLRPAGLFPACLLLCLLSGLAAPDVRYREIIVYSIAYSATCAAIFKYLLSITISFIVLPF